MPRVDVTEESQRWQFCCPECDSVNWRCNDGTFQCLSCGEVLTELRDRTNDERIPRSQFEFVGPHANWKAKYAAGKRP